ncbi:MAG: hypothetical protein HYX51_11620, partial [Chloroflexi bacterium]|nr:hypothetical protein [Chloroflexota bacterium]
MPTASVTPSPSASPTATATATATAVVTSTPTPAGTSGAGQARTPAPASELPLLLAADRTTGGGAARERALTQFVALSVTPGVTSINAGVPFSVTITAPGRSSLAVQVSSTDPGFVPTPAQMQTLTPAGGQTMAVTVTGRFATAGSHTITATDPTGTYLPGTSAPVTVAETVLSLANVPATATQGTATSFTVQAKTTGGTVLTDWAGQVVLTASNASVAVDAWGGGTSPSNAYPFVAGDLGQHAFAPTFRYAGPQTITVKDAYNPNRSVTSSSIAVSTTATAPYAHEAAPSAAKLADGSIGWAYLSSQGTLYYRRNVGTLSEPAWRDAVLVRDTTTAGGGIVGADAPSLVVFGTALALFHTYTDGTLLQVWVTASTDNGLTWGAPTKLTTEPVHVADVQAVVSGATLYLFWSRQDTGRSLLYQTTTDLTNWSGVTTIANRV